MGLNKRVIRELWVRVRVIVRVFVFGLSVSDGGGFYLCDCESEGFVVDVWIFDCYFWGKWYILKLRMWGVWSDNGLSFFSLVVVFFYSFYWVLCLGNVWFII